jgi:arylformamidase
VARKAAEGRVEGNNLISPALVIDISRTLDESTAVYPGDIPFLRESTLSLSRGDYCNVTVLRGSAHAGTHVDLPRHLKDTEAQFPLEAFVGPAVVIEAKSWEDVVRTNIPSGQRVLFKTKNSANLSDNFDPNFECITSDVVHWLAKNEAILVGVDGPSVDPAASELLENHHALLEACIAILENLDLSAVEPGNYDLIALPLKIPSADATWVRAILLK